MRLKSSLSVFAVEIKTKIRYNIRVEFGIGGIK